MIKYVALTIIFAMTVSCAHFRPTLPVDSGRRGDHDKEFAQAARYLDYVAESVEDFGTISVSAPCIMRTPTDAFAFGLERSTKDYYNDIGVQGALGVRQYRVLDLQLAVNTETEELVKALHSIRRTASPDDVERVKSSVAKIEMLQNLLDKETGIIPETTVGTAANTALTIAHNVVSRAATQSAEAPAEVAVQSPAMPELISKGDRIALAMLPKEFEPPIDFYKGDVTISHVERLMATSHAKTTENLLNWLGSPDVAALGENKIVYLCLLMVSCNPGRLTREGYAAEVVVHVDYNEVVEAGSEGEEESDFSRANDRYEPRPYVIAAYPMIDAQILDLSYSLREQLSVASKLQAAGYGVAGKALLDYAKRLEQDARTRSAVTVGSAKSYSGQTFGYRIEPRLIALGDQKKSATPAMRMDGKTFPALVLLMVDRKDIDPEYGGYGTFKELHFSVEPHWVPLNAPRLFRLPPVRLSDKELMRRALCLDKAATIYDEKSDNNYHQANSLYRRLKTLNASGMGNYIILDLPIPPENKRVINSIAPKKAWINRPTLFTLQGEQLGANVLRVIIGGIETTIIERSHNAVVVSFPGWPSADSASGMAKVVVTLTTGVQCLEEEIQFDLKGAPAPQNGAKATAPAATTIVSDRDARGNITKLSVTGDTAPLAKVEALTDLLKPAQSGSFSLEFQGESKARVSSQP